MSIADIQRRYAGHVTASVQDEATLDKLKNQGGFSHNVMTGEEPKSGYMVGLHKDLGGEEEVHPMSELSAEHIAHHRQRAMDTLGANSNVYQGGWIHDGHAYLDRSINIDDEKSAREMGRKNKQLAIWDVKNKREISLGE